MRTKGILILLAAFLLLGGCATGSKAPNVYVNGAPANNHLLILTSTRYDITLYSQVIHQYIHKEGDESDIWHRYVPVNEVVKIDRKTAGLALSVRVLNKDKVDYKVLYVCRATGEDGKERVEKEFLYEGDFSRKDFVIPVYKDKGMVSGIAHVEITDGKGVLLMVSQVARFQRKEERTSQRRLGAP